MELKGDWIRTDIEQMQMILNLLKEVPINTCPDLYRHPAVNGLIFEFPAEKSGWSEVSYVSFVDNDEVPKDLLRDALEGGSTVIGNKMARICCFGRFGNTLFPNFEAYKWVTESGVIGGGVKAFERGRRFSREFIEEHEDHLFLAFLAVQYLMFRHSDWMSSRKEYRKALKPERSRELTAPYTSPGKVKIYQIRRLDKEAYETVRKEAASYARHCPAWGVRGHYRHYASGAVVYIKPHIKGQNKAAYVGREYVLFPDSFKEDCE